MATFDVKEALQATKFFYIFAFSRIKNNVDNKSGYHPQSPPPCRQHHCIVQTNSRQDQLHQLHIELNLILLSLMF